MREISFQKDINPYCLSSVLATFGKTKVHITVSMEDNVPPFLFNKRKGWITAEYSMLPGATHDRVKRERKGASGRSIEIQRLISRSLRSGFKLENLGERSFTVDCDVLVADGGTRTASISGGFLALWIGFDRLLKAGILSKDPLVDQIGAIGMGINGRGDILADLNYEEDSNASTDFNVVTTKSGGLVEVQGTAERNPFTNTQLMQLVEKAHSELKVVFDKQYACFNED